MKNRTGVLPFISKDSDGLNGTLNDTRYLTLWHLADVNLSMSKICDN